MQEAQDRACDELQVSKPEAGMHFAYATIKALYAFGIEPQVLMHIVASAIASAASNPHIIQIIPDTKH
jgi:hypothetical protein